jgi:hypothetical protein
MFKVIAGGLLKRAGFGGADRADEDLTSDHVQRATVEATRRIGLSPFFSAILDERIGRAEYRDLLQAYRIAYRALECVTRSPTAPQIEAVWRPTMERLERIDYDLCSFSEGRTPGDPRVQMLATAYGNLIRSVHEGRRLPARDLVGADGERTAIDDWELIGHIYTHEWLCLRGATHRQLVTGCSALDGVSLRFLDPYGSRAEQSWSAFCERLDALDASRGARNRIVHGALTALHWTDRVLAECAPKR